MYKNILLPLDESRLAEEKVPTAIELAKIFNATIILLEVVEITPLSQEDREMESKALGDRAEKYLGQIKEMIEEAGVSTEVVIKKGKAESEILDFAEQTDAVLIVMSTHGLGGFGRWALGSVSQKLVNESPKPVLMLRSSSRDFLRGKTILAVDDEPDVLETLEELLDMCEIHKAAGFEQALKKLNAHKYDIVILDIMGVNGFDLLKQTTDSGIPTVMLTSHAMDASSLMKSAKGGAVFYLPKEKVVEIEEVLVDVLKSGGGPIWKDSFWRFVPYFRKRFGWSDKEKEAFMKEMHMFLTKQ